MTTLFFAKNVPDMRQIISGKMKREKVTVRTINVPATLVWSSFATWPRGCDEDTRTER
jgi:hypothetical protein